MDSEARNFNGTYPLAGERLGPAWRETWKTLSADEWLSGNAIAAEIAPRCGVALNTVLTLLRQAKRAGRIEQKLIIKNSRQVAHYRAKYNEEK